MIRYRPEYGDSRAVVIGIDEYHRTSPLSYAVSDAKALSAALIGRLGFPSDSVTILVNDAATGAAIREALFDLTDGGTSPDDRVMVFFAGHGYTMRGHRGEVGFLVPVEGDPANPSTLIRWQELLAPSELIAAKHLLYVMDACYGGLALQRSDRRRGGGRRFLKDMLQRYSRQVITAGKANEVVSDAGGPRPDHSVFTGHLLDALDGAARSTDGVLTAVNVMNYVYERVSRDYESRQTPHYGFLDGDGDFIFDAGEGAEDGADDPGTTQDVLVTLAAPTDAADDTMSDVDRLKEYLVDERYRIRLDDVIRSKVRDVTAVVASDRFPIDTPTLAHEDIERRLAEYETACADLLDYTIVLSRWGKGERQNRLLGRVVRGLSDFDGEVGGKVAWIGLRWYPLLLSIYSGGIAALSDDEYHNLSTLLLTRAGAARSRGGPEQVAVAVVDGINEADRHDVFKSLPGHERHHVPRSEYLFLRLQSRLEDLLLLGREYEDLFDRFEVLLALTYADLSIQEAEPAFGVWGPIGRFGWKWHHRVGSPFERFVSEALAAGSSWPLLQAGFFGGDPDRFAAAAKRFEEETLSKARMW